MKEEVIVVLIHKFDNFEQFIQTKLYFIRELWQGEDWARDIYDPCTQDFKFYDKNDSNCTNTINRNKVEKIIGTESDT